jgi:hypothetical protein
MTSIACYFVLAYSKQTDQVGIVGHAIPPHSHVLSIEPIDPAIFIPLVSIPFQRELRRLHSSSSQTCESIVTVET